MIRFAPVRKLLNAKGIAELQKYKEMEPFFIAGHSDAP